MTSSKPKNLLLRRLEMHKDRKIFIPHIFYYIPKWKKHDTVHGVIPCHKLMQNSFK